MKNKILIQLFVIAFITFSCNSDDDSLPDTIEQNVEDETISNVDTKLLDQIKKAGDLFSTTQVWDGFKLKEYPLYLIHKNKEGKADRGIVINPQSTIEGAVALEQELSAGLKAYRYDKDVDRALQVLTDPEEGNGLYDFNFKIDGKDYYIQVYNDDEVTAGENLATYPGGFFDPRTITIGAIDFIIHENFHTYQENWKPTGKKISKAADNSKNATSSSVLELKILLHQIFKNFPNVDLNQEKLEQKLKQYVAIQSALGVEKFQPFTVTDEGSARYIERMAIRSIFPNRANEPFIPGTVLENEYGIINQETLDMVFGFGLTYEIGASVCFALSKVDNVALKRIEERSTLLQIVTDKYNLSDQELEQYLQEAKDSVDWNAIQNKAQAFSNLK